MKMKYLLLTGILLGSGLAAETNAQLLKKLGKRAERAAERTVERRVDREVSKKTDQALDSILEPGPGRSKEPENTPESRRNPKNGDVAKGNPDTPPPSSASAAKDIAVYSKFDFVPGDVPLFFDDFSNEYIGDFPSKWNTNGSGEVVSIGDDARKWLEIKSGHGTYYIPQTPSLPKDYTIEFDILASGLDKKTASTAVLRIILSDDRNFKLGSYALAQLSFCQYTPVGIRIRNAAGDINNEVKADIRKAISREAHVSVAVNEQRFRLWVNEEKYLDVPRLIPSSPRPEALKFELLYFQDGKERLFMTDLKVAEGGLDLRRQLLENGTVSTTGILFESGSARLQPQSMGVIRQFYQVLQQDPAIHLRIIGHTDADGDDASNMELSKKRAETVKNTLVAVYGVDGGRLETEGKGESLPVADNGSPEGKAKNRRVEFVNTTN